MRSADVQRFLTESATALRRSTAGEAALAAERAISLWGASVGTPGTAAPHRLAVCDWLDMALDHAKTGARRDLAASLAALSPRLTWKRRASASIADRVFWDGHANAMILGPGGLEEQSDIWVGATVMAPGVTYADHDHPPEEVYLSLSPGQWWNSAMDWTDPGDTGAIYNPPGILHKMRAGDGPFLALWYLPA